MSMTGGDLVQKKPAQADTIYFGGPILSMDASDPGPEAVAVAGDRILATGSLDAMRALGHAGTRQVDLAGRTLLPGFIDAHSHFVDAALLTASVDLNSYPLGSVHCIEDMVALLRQRAEITPPGQCIQGWGYDDSLLAEKRHPTRQDLDRASTRHPIVLQHISGWVTTGNSLALEQVGLAGAGACAGDNVVLYRDAGGVPTGVIEAATSPLLRLAPPPDEAGFMQAMRAGSETYLASGCTTAQDGWLVGGERLRLLHDALRQDALGLRLVIYPVGQECSMEEFCTTYPQVPSGEALDERCMLIMGAAKLACDGSIQAYTGYLSRPYHVLPPDKPADYRGYPSCDIDAMTRRIAEQLPTSSPGFSERSRRRRFSSSSARRSSWPCRSMPTAPAVRLPTISKSAASRPKSIPGSTRRSMLNVPITVSRRMTGTQMKATRSPAARAPVRFRKRGSVLTSATISGLPVSATRPVMPSPSR